MLRLPIHLIASERPLINVDATLFINIGLWILLFLILRSLLWRPMLKLIDARENQASRARCAEAKRLEAEGKEPVGRSSRPRRSAHACPLAMRARNSAAMRKRTETEIIADDRARDGTQKALEAQRADIRKQRETLHNEIAATVPQLAADIATKVLGREVRS